MSQIMKLYFTFFYATDNYFLSLGDNFCPQYFASKYAFYNYTLSSKQYLSHCRIICELYFESVTFKQ
jgi:hypothetical protein